MAIKKTNDADSQSEFSIFMVEDKLSDKSPVFSVRITNRFDINEKFEIPCIDKNHATEAFCLIKNGLRAANGF